MSSLPKSSRSDNSIGSVEFPFGGEVQTLPPNGYKYATMKIYTETKGNIRNPEWRKRAAECTVEYIDLDRWTAQKSRFVAESVDGNEYAVALARHTQLLDGDIIEYDPERHTIVAVRIDLNEVMAIDMGRLADEKPETIIRIAMELGHAVGNQHWPAVIKGTTAYIPLTVDKKVMDSVMRTHHIEGISYSFQPGSEVIPYLAPHEIRRLFGGTGPDGSTHHHHYDREQACAGQEHTR